MSNTSEVHTITRLIQENEVLLDAKWRDRGHNHCAADLEALLADQEPPA